MMHNFYFAVAVFVLSCNSFSQDRHHLSLQTGMLSSQQSGIRAQSVQSSSSFSITSLTATDAQSFRKVGVFFALAKAENRMLTQYLEIGKQVFPFSYGYEVNSELGLHRIEADNKYKLGFEYSISLGRMLIDTVFQDTAEVTSGSLGLGLGLVQIYQLYPNIYFQFTIGGEYALGFLSPVEYSAVNTTVLMGVRAKL